MKPGNRAMVHHVLLFMDGKGAGDRNDAADPGACLLYTSDAADERSSGDLGGRRIITKRKR